MCRFSFDLDMLGQAQNAAEFIIENAGQAPVTDVVFTQTTLEFAKPEPQACTPDARGERDFAAVADVLDGGRRCTISRIILRAKGVPASGPDVP